MLSTFLCTDPDTIISELNYNELFFRPKLIDTPRSAISVGSNYRIERNGVIKEWKFFSAKAGMVIFQVWRRHVSEYPDMWVPLVNFYLCLLDAWILSTKYDSFVLVHFVKYEYVKLPSIQNEQPNKKKW